MDNSLIEKFAKKFLNRKILHTIQIEGLSLSGRKYFLITTETDQQSLVAYFPEHDKQSFDDFINMQTLLDNHKINVPQILGSDPQNLLIIQQYIGSNSLYSVVMSHGIKDKMVIKLYQQALDLLITMQQIDGLETITDIKFDLDKIIGEYEILIKPYLIDYLWKNDLNVKQKELFKGFYHQLAAVLSEVPRTFCHRDFQSTNLLLDQQNKLFVIDFQGARQALLQYDLVSLLEDNYVSLPACIKTTLLNYYIQQLQRRLRTSVNLKMFKRNYTYTLIQRKLHDLAIFIRASVQLGDDKYLKYIPCNMKLVIKLLQKEGVFIPPKVKIIESIIDR